MSRVWAIRARGPRLDLVRDGLIAVERPRAGDLAALGNDPSALFAVLRKAYPARRPGQLRGWTAVLLRLAFEAAEGDLVVHPGEAARTYRLGVVAGPYELRDAARGLHARATAWAAGAIPREALSHAAQFELTQPPAFFPVRGAAAELWALHDAATSASVPAARLDRASIKSL